MGQPQANKKILIIDDTPTNIRILGEILLPIYDVSIATSGPQALDIMKNFIPDLILLDIMMPEMDGFEVCEKIKSDDRTKDIPIIFVTAKDEVNDEARGFEAGGWIIL